MFWQIHPKESKSTHNISVFYYHSSHHSFFAFVLENRAIFHENVLFMLTRSGVYNLFFNEYKSWKFLSFNF